MLVFCPCLVFQLSGCALLRSPTFPSFMSLHQCHAFFLIFLYFGIIIIPPFVVSIATTVESCLVWETTCFLRLSLALSLSLSLSLSACPSFFPSLSLFVSPCSLLSLCATNSLLLFSFSWSISLFPFTLPCLSLHMSHCLALPGFYHCCSRCHHRERRA